MFKAGLLNVKHHAIGQEVAIYGPWLVTMYQIIQSSSKFTYSYY